MVFALRFRYYFSIDFGSILDPFWLPKWSQVGAKFAPKTDLKSMQNSDRFQERSWVGIGVVLGRSWGVWGRSQAGFGAVWAGLGAVLGWVGARLGRIWGGLGDI